MISGWNILNRFTNDVTGKATPSQNVWHHHSFYKILTVSTRKIWHRNQAVKCRQLPTPKVIGFLRQIVILTFQFKNMKTAGVGIDFTSSTNVVLTKLTWTRIDIVQAEDRCRKIWTKTPSASFTCCYNPWRKGYMDSNTTVKFLNSIEKQKELPSSETPCKACTFFERYKPNHWYV